MKCQKSAWNRMYSEQGSLWNGPAQLDFEIRGRVLELGCGNGKTLSSLIKNCDAIGVDFSEAAAGLCRKRVPGAEVVVADACSLPFANKSFDSVVAFHVLEHIPERKKAVHEIQRVLREGGSAFVKVFSVRDMRFGKGRMSGENSYARGKFGIECHYFTEEELRMLFSGFEERSLRLERWKVRYHGIEHAREKLVAEFLKPSHKEQ